MAHLLLSITPLACAKSSCSSSGVPTSLRASSIIMSWLRVMTSSPWDPPSLHQQVNHIIVQELNYHALVGQMIIISAIDFFNVFITIHQGLYIRTSSTFKGLQHHTQDMFMGSVASRGPYKVIIITQELHDPDKGCSVIKTPTVGPRTSLGFLHQARGFIGLFSHLNHTRGLQGSRYLLWGCQVFLWGTMTSSQHE